MDLSCREFRSFGLRIFGVVTVENVFIVIGEIGYIKRGLSFERFDGLLILFVGMSKRFILDGYWPMFKGN